MKRLLLISYYFPPCGGAAVQRWLRFIPQLIAKNWQITVVCPSRGDYPFHDYSLLTKLPGQVKVIRTRSISINGLWDMMMSKKQAIPYGSMESSGDTTRLKKLMIWVRVNLIIPDMRVFWNSFAYQAAAQELKQSIYDLVITSGPPHSTHLVGLKLQKRFGMKWVADFRDPWSTIHYLQMQEPMWFSRALHKHLEKKVLAQADRSLIVSQPIADSFPRGNKTVILNGFDELDYLDLSYNRVEEFRIKYVGQITAGQDIGALLSSISEFVKTHDVSFKFIGTKLTEQEIQKFNAIIPQISAQLFVDHRQALAEMVDAELLVIIINDTNDNLGIITTKLFEYIGSRTPILCIGPSRSEAAKLIRSYEAGKNFERCNDPQIGIYLEELYQLWGNSNALRNLHDVSPLSVQNQIDILDAVFTKLIE